MRSIQFYLATIALLVFGATSYAASNAELTGTLKKIKASGKVMLGVRDASIPFSFIEINRIIRTTRSISVCASLTRSKNNWTCHT